MYFSKFKSKLEKATSSMDKKNVFQYMKELYTILKQYQNVPYVEKVC